MQIDVYATDTVTAHDLRRRITNELAAAGELVTEIVERNGWWFVINGVGGACHGVPYRTTSDAARDYEAALKERS
jgi:hypothetical protein